MIVNMHSQVITLESNCIEVSRLLKHTQSCGEIHGVIVLLECFINFYTKFYIELKGALYPLIYKLYLISFSRRHYMKVNICNECTCEGNKGDSQYI